MGDEHVQSAAEDLVCYGYDATDDSRLPDLIVHPGSHHEVVEIVKVAADAKVPLVPRGAGSGLSGGAVAQHGGIIINFDRMNRIKELDSKNMVAVVEPGVINWNLRLAAAGAGLFYPPDPGSSRFCTLGGNVAENAGGPYGARYGVTGDYIRGLKAVLATGETLHAGGRSRRDVAGYDLISLLVGSEGTLAIITEIIIRLIPARPGRVAAFIAFNDFHRAIDAIQAINAAGLPVAALEIMDRTVLGCLDKFVHGRLPVVAAMLLIELDGDPACLQPQLDKAIARTAALGGEVVVTAEGEKCEELWEVRRAISPALGHAARSKLGEDICVPVSMIGPMYERIREIGEKYDLEIAFFGHAGDGNLHPNILTDRRDEEKMKQTRDAVSELFAAAADLGGTISGEHGVGSVKAPFMRLGHDSVALRLMREIKESFDPEGILNPGKILPEAREHN